MENRQAPRTLLRVRQLQTRLDGTPLERVRALEAPLARAAADGVDLVALPEMFCCPYETPQFPRLAEPEGGPVWSACAALAARNGLWLSAGSVPERDGGRVYNTAYVFDRQGRQAAKHRKMHLFDIAVDGGQHFRESDTLSAGSRVTVFDTAFGRLGLAICYDIRFPELFRLMALDGALAVLVPAAFNGTTGPAHWELTFRARALDNQLFCLGTAPARDPAASYQSWGHTIACDPWGRVLAQLDEGPGLQLTDLDLTYPAQVRRQLPLLAQRRTDVYTLTAAGAGRDGQ